MVSQPNDKDPLRKMIEQKLEQAGFQGIHVEHVEHTLSPKDTLLYIASMAKQMAASAEQALVMYEQAEKSGTSIGPETIAAIAAFQPTAEKERQMVGLNHDIGWIGSHLFEDGVKMTRDEMRQELLRRGFLLADIQELLKNSSQN